jgi:hypothetical protein
MASASLIAWRKPAQWTGVLVYAILASAAVYTYIYTPELDHRRAVRECQVIVGCDDGDESFGACINRRIAEIQAKRFKAGYE